MIRFCLFSRVMAKLAIRTMGIVRRFVVVPATDDNRAEYQQHDHSHRNPEDAKCIPHGHAGTTRPKHIDCNLMYDAGKALPVSGFVDGTAYLKRWH